MSKEINVFGERAAQIRDGEIFKAEVYSVEGRKCVRLVPLQEKIDQACRTHVEVFSS